MYFLINISLTPGDINHCRHSKVQLSQYFYCGVVIALNTHEVYNIKNSIYLINSYWLGIGNLNKLTKHFVL